MGKGNGARLLEKRRFWLRVAWGPDTLIMGCDKNNGKHERGTAPAASCDRDCRGSCRARDLEIRIGSNRDPFANVTRDLPGSATGRARIRAPGRLRSATAHRRARRGRGAQAAAAP